MEETQFRIRLYFRRGLKKLARWSRFLLLAWLLLSINSVSLLPEQAFDLHLGGLTAGQRFNWWAWEAEAIAEEVGWWLGGRPWPGSEAGPIAALATDLGGAVQGGRLSTQAEQRQAVLAYIERQREIAALKDRVRRAYARSEGAGAETVRLEEELARLSQEQAAVTPQVERILAAQVGQVLLEEGFSLGGQAWPVVTFRFNQMPTYLIISQRAEISQYRSLYLLPDMPAGERAELEAQIEADLDVSALVDNVGGIGSWPTMIADPLALPSVIDTIAHEWTHNYLGFQPLGRNYGFSRDLTTMNETVASLVGGEVAELVLARFYPELLPSPAAVSEPAAALPFNPNTAPLGPPEENFGQAMRRIRFQVDAWLAEGEIEAAEAYMEAERQKLVAKGYYLRRLNQAYFAFHGSYATGPASVDPIGPWLRQLRAQHQSLRGFVEQAAEFRSLDALLLALEEPPGQNNEGLKGTKD